MNVGYWRDGFPRLTLTLLGGSESINLEFGECVFKRREKINQVSFSSGEAAHEQLPGIVAEHEQLYSYFT